MAGAAFDPTVDASLRSWAPVPASSDFPIQNLPYGMFRRTGTAPHVGVRIGDQVVDLVVLFDAGLLRLEAAALPREVFAADSLNPLLALGRVAWTALRRVLSDLLRDGAREVAGPVPDHALIPIDDVEVLLPVRIGDYVDFYSSLEHATNLGKILRPGSPALAPNWRHLPVGYGGRAGSVVASGTPVRRPHGQLPGPGPDDPPTFGPTQRLDFELEIGFVTGPGNAWGSPIPISRARDHIFGLVLVNDWSARDIQRWEYAPLGPFLAKSFATTISPWVVPLEALEPFRVAGPAQDPVPLPYLRPGEPWGFDIDLEVGLRPPGGGETTISRTNFRRMYWSMAQQLAHVTVNGASVRPGDLYASGTISGSEPGTYGSLMELSWGGTQPLALDDGSTRTFLQDGDSVVMRGRCSRDGAAAIGFGGCAGRVVSAVED